jgi:thiol-disulfide isomerase/thioredoxin
MTPRSLWSLVVSVSALAAGGIALAMPAVEPPTQSAPAASAPAVSPPSPSTALPRPVDSEWRAMLGFPEPRAHEVVLTELDALSAAMRPIIEQNDVWKQRFQEYREMQGQRVSLVSELEEGGYAGERLAELLELKLADIGGMEDWPSYTYARVRQELAERHAGSPIGVRARGEDMLGKVHEVLAAGFRIHPGDYARLAEVELARRDDELAGITLLEALHFEPENAELQTHWQDWIVEKLGAESIGVRTVMRRRIFDKPVRLEGEGLSHEKLDTAEWLGDVILVDFWGTWCIPCKQAMPLVKAARDRHAADGLRVVGVLCDFELEKAQGYLESHGYDWPQLTRHDATPEDYDHPIATRYAIGAFPTLWIIDRSGVLRDAIDAESLEELLPAYLAEPRPER